MANSGDPNGLSDRSVFWTKVGIVVTILGIAVALYLFFNGSPESSVPTPTPAPTLLTVDEPSLGPLRTASQIEGLPVHNRVTPAFLAGSGWSFHGVAADLVALTAVQNGQSVAQRLRLAVVPEEGPSTSVQPTEYCSNLLHDFSEGRLALFQLPRTGKYRLESSLGTSDRDLVILRAYSLQNSSEREIGTARVVQGVMDYPGEIDLYALQFSGGERLYVQVETDNIAGRVSLVRIGPDRKLLDQFTAESLLRLEPKPQAGSVLVLYADQVHKPFKYALTVRQFAKPTVLNADGQTVDGNLEFPGESKQYAITVPAGSTWQVSLDCTPSFKGRMTIARPIRDQSEKEPTDRDSGETTTEVCDPLCSNSIEAEVDGTMYIKVFSDDGTHGQYHLSVWPAER